MKTYKQLLENLNEMFPGSKEYIAKYGKNPLSSRSEPEETGRRVHKGTYGTGEERPAVQDVEQAPKRGRGRPPGKYGSYKTNPENKGKYKGVHAARKAKLKEALEYMGALSESEIQDFVNSLDEQTFADLCGFIGLNESREYDVDEYFGLVEDVEQLDELSKSTLGSYIKKSSHDVATRGAAVRQASVDARAAREKHDYNTARAKEAMSDKIFNKSWKRREGMAKAVDRLTKEDFAVNESVSPINIYSNFISEHKGG